MDCIVLSWVLDQLISELSICRLWYLFLLIKQNLQTFHSSPSRCLFQDMSSDRETCQGHDPHLSMSPTSVCGMSSSSRPSPNVAILHSLMPKTGPGRRRSSGFRNQVSGSRFLLEKQNMFSSAKTMLAISHCHPKKKKVSKRRMTVWHASTPHECGNHYWGQCLRGPHHLTHRTWQQLEKAAGTAKEETKVDIHMKPLA